MLRTQRAAAVHPQQEVKLQAAKAEVKPPPRVSDREEKEGTSVTPNTLWSSVAVCIWPGYFRTDCLHQTHYLCCLALAWLSGTRMPDCVWCVGS